MITPNTLGRKGKCFGTIPLICIIGTKEFKNLVVIERITGFPALDKSLKIVLSSFSVGMLITFVLP